MTPTQFKAYGFGVFPTSMQSIVVDTGEAPIAEYFKSPQDYEQVLQFALENLSKDNRRQVLFVIPGGRK